MHVVADFTICKYHQIFIEIGCLVMQTYTLEFRPYVGPIYNAILTRLANQDQDQVCQTAFDNSEMSPFLTSSWLFSYQEVKECAISCMSLIISTFGDNLQLELPACLPILVDRMGNEITRLTAVKVNDLSPPVLFAHWRGSAYLWPLECLTMN